MSTRASNARHVRQRKLNTKQALRVIRERDIDDAPDDDGQRHIPQVETGVEKGEEVEFHLQAVINANAAALGAQAQQSYIPTPEATKAKDVKYDDLYPKAFKEPATYIRFSSTVEDSVGSFYCMNEHDAEFLTQLNSGKISWAGKTSADKAQQCSEDVFEETMSHFELTSQRVQPYANVDSAPLLTLDELEQAREEPLSADATRFLKPIYDHWAVKHGHRALMPMIKVRVLDTTSEADDADPYICFRRREVRQTRKTRGRDAQIVEKLKKLRVELEAARNLVQLVRQREDFNKESLEVSRKVFEQRRQLKEVKASRNIVGEKGEDEDLLVNQKPAPKTKPRQDTSQPRPPTIRLRSGGERSALENDLLSLSDLQAEAEAHVQHTIESRKDQHKRWNMQWHDLTWNPITPPPDPVDQPPKWAPLVGQDVGGYPTPPPSLPSRSSQERDGDVEMRDCLPVKDDDDGDDHDNNDRKPRDSDMLDTHAHKQLEQPQFTFFIPPTHSSHYSSALASGYFGSNAQMSKKQQRQYLLDHIPSSDRNPSSLHPSCRIRYGRGGRRHLEVRRPRRPAIFHSGVVSDSDSDDEVDDYHQVPDAKLFDYRCALNTRSAAAAAASSRADLGAGALSTSDPQHASLAHKQQQQQQQQRSGAWSASMAHAEQAGAILGAAITAASGGGGSAGSHQASPPQQQQRRPSIVVTKTESAG